MYYTGWGAPKHVILGIKSRTTVAVCDTYLRHISYSPSDQSTPSGARRHGKLKLCESLTLVHVGLNCLRLPSVADTLAVRAAKVVLP